jgi:peptide/nickel transport system permease protein
VPVTNPVTDPVPVDHEGGVPAAPDTNRLATRAARVAVGAATIVTGMVLILLGTTLLATEVVMTGRVVLVLVGIAATYSGTARVIRALTRPSADVAYWLSLVWLVLLVGTALLAPILPFGEAENSAKTLADPILARPDLLSDHPLGTNQLGLDLLARTIYGARTSLMVSLLAASIGMVLGAGFGLVAGYLRGAADTTIGIVTNVSLAFPPLVLLLALAAVLPRNSRNQALALALLVIPVNVRLARAMAISFSQREFVLAAKAMGAKRRRIMVTELLPNVLVPLVSYGFIVIAMLIVAEASLSFLGLGLPQPSPTWGNMIAEGRAGVFEQEPHLVLVPASVLFVTVLSFNLVGERLRQRLGTGKQVAL